MAPKSVTAEVGETGRRAFDETASMPGHLLRRCQQIAVSIFLKQCRDFDLTPLQFAVLSALDQHGAMDQMRLGGLTALDRTTVGVVVTKLVDGGLAARRQSDKDKRSKVVTISPEGQRLLERAAPAVRDVQRRLLAPLDPAEREMFVRLLARIAEGGNSESRAPLREI